MLNEIYKGMDNAAEQINENFKNGSIVDSGQTEKGSYIKFGNGFQILWKAGVTFTRNDSGTVRFDWEFPIPFSNSDYAFGAIPFASTLANTNNLSVVQGGEIPQARESVQIQITADSRPFVPGDTMVGTVWAFGFGDTV